MNLIYDLTSHNYLDFIGKLRDQARDKEKVSHGRPVLPLELDSLLPFIHVNLLVGGIDKGLVKIRRYDLRLINYQDPLGNVIDVDDFNLYDDESRLLESVFVGLLMGLPSLIKAVNSLADVSKMCNESKSYDARTSLAVLCIVLAEAVKMDLISCWLDKAFKSNAEVCLSSWFLNRINDWGDLSATLLDAELHFADADCNCYVPCFKNGWDDGRRVLGVTCQDIARCLGILKSTPPQPVPMVEEFPTDTALAEVYSVSVVFNGGRSGFIYGTIKVDNRYDTLYIYARDHTNFEPIESHGTLSLQDPEPKNFIVVDGHLHMELDLREGGTDNNEVVKGKLLWDAPLRLDRYNTRLSAYVRGKNGYAIVYYTVFEEAIQASVEATLLAKEGHPNASHAVCVCGNIGAYYRNLSYCSEILQNYYTTMLFGKPGSKEPSALSEFGESKFGQWVKPGENIKLSRSSVAVDVSDALIIKAELKSCEGKPIVTGSMEWVPRELGEFQRIMEGHPDDSHVLQVKVIWREISLIPKQ